MSERENVRARGERENVCVAEKMADVTESVENVCVTVRMENVCNGQVSERENANMKSERARSERASVWGECVGGVLTSEWSGCAAMGARPGEEMRPGEAMPAIMPPRRTTLGTM